MRLRPTAVAVSVLLYVAGHTGAQGRTRLVPESIAPAVGAAQPVSPVANGAAFDPTAATEGWLAKVPAAARAQSDAYFEGGYWLQLWDFLVTLGIAGLLLASGLSARLRDWAERTTRRRPLAVALYAVGYIAAVGVLTFPLTVYEGFFREHAYGLSNQTFGAWFRDTLVGFAVSLVVVTISLVLLYAVLRRAPRLWWALGAGLGVVLISVFSLLNPVYVAPLFNSYTELRDPDLRTPILSMARANGIPAEHVYVYDASRQSKRISANVSGMLGTLRISLNDNLLKRTSPAAVEAVMGHEMGHYVLNHIYEMLMWFAVLIFFGAALVAWAWDRIWRRRGERWGIRGVADPAGLPLLAALFATYAFLATPLFNTVIRTNEAEADIFGLNASRQPDGFAEAALLLGEYRKLHPGPVEEWVFFDHPSGYRRILGAMQWKAEHWNELPPS